MHAQLLTSWLVESSHLYGFHFSLLLYNTIGGTVSSYALNDERKEEAQ